MVVWITGEQGIFQEDPMSHLLFVSCIIPLTTLLRKEHLGYNLDTDQQVVNYSLFIDSLTFFRRSQVELESLIEVLREFSKEKKINGGLDKFSALSLKLRAKVLIEKVVICDDQMMV